MSADRVTRGIAVTAPGSALTAVNGSRTAPPTADAASPIAPPAADAALPTYPAVARVAAAETRTVSRAVSITELAEVGTPPVTPTRETAGTVAPPTGSHMPSSTCVMRTPSAIA